MRLGVVSCLHLQQAFLLALLCGFRGNSAAEPATSQDPLCASTAATLEERVGATLQGALASDTLALPGQGVEDLERLRKIYAGDVSALGRDAVDDASQSECGHELLLAIKEVSSKGFEFQSFAEAWRQWVQGHTGPQGPGSWEALLNLASGTGARASGSHYIDLRGAARVPALLLLAGRIDDEGLALASREIQAVSHENPRAFQVGELLLRAALRLLREPLVAAPGSCSSRREAEVSGTSSKRPPAQPATQETKRRRRERMAWALREAAAAVGPQYRSIVDEAVAEAQSRDGILAALGGHLAPDNPLAKMHSDAAVLGRLTASGETPGEDVQSGLIPYVTPAIIWFAIAYSSFHEATLASAQLGGDTAPRGLFVGLLHAALQGGGGDAPKGGAARFRSRVPPFLPTFALCVRAGHCQVAGGASAGERLMHRVSVSAAVVALGSEGGVMPRYRIFVRLDASRLLEERPAQLERPHDWDEEEDGPWEPPDEELSIEGKVACLARYFQFTTSQGRHAPFGLWPQHALCQLTREEPTGYDSFDVELPEPLSLLIGGAVLGKASRDVKLPSLVVDPEASPPEWAGRCTHVGLVRLPQGKWYFAE